MEWITKVISVLKIPLKILLPALWLFTGVLTLFNKDILKSLVYLNGKLKMGSFSD